MGLKKYEIITVGSDKRVRALRSWQVGDRYVNIGDVGGIVYDEKTLSQDGACWLFKGNFGFPGARIGGDSIVDVGEAALSPSGAPNVDILGSSVVVGSKLRFESEQTEAGTYETKLSIIDSRVEINPVNGTGMISVKPGGSYSITPGASYPDSVIRNSKVVINGHATADRTTRLMSVFIGCNVVIDSTLGSSQGAGVYSNVKNLTFTGISFLIGDIAARSIIQATDCDNFAVSPTIFPGVVTAQTANMPFIFQGCNVPDGRFYHHAQIANTYKNIDFAKAQSDLGKATANADITLVSSEVEGMYRLYANGFGALVESIDSVKSMNIASANLPASYGTNVYADAYLSGLFDISGTNVFGNKVRSHPLAQVLNVQPRAVQGEVPTHPGTIVTGADGVSNRVSVLVPFRINSSQGLSVDNVPAGVDARAVYVTHANEVVTSTGWANPSWKPATPALVYYAAYIMFRKTGDAAITPEDLADVTVTVYNGCKIVNTGETAVPMKGNIRVEDNATLINSSITGTGYFGGNAVMSGSPINGCVYMKDNAKVTKTGSLPIRNLKMTENAYAVMGDFSLNGRIHLSDNARFTPTSAAQAEGDLVMEDNAVVSGAVNVSGVLTMKDNAKVSAGALTTLGDITVCGSYNQTAARSWTGKRVIDDQNAPTYDNNVKTQYDF